MLNRFDSLQPPWTAAHLVPLSMGFSREEFWSGLPCSPPAAAYSLPKFSWKNPYVAEWRNHRFKLGRIHSHVQEVSDTWPCVPPLSFLLTGLGLSLLLSESQFFCEIRIMPLCVHVPGNTSYIVSQPPIYIYIYPSCLCLTFSSVTSRSLKSHMDFGHSFEQWSCPVLIWG